MSPNPTMPSSERLRSLDAYRGFVMLLMASGGLGLATVATRVSPGGEPTWVDIVASQFDHVAWRGCVLWDLIQPSFMFIVGAAMPFSLAARKARGEPFGRQFAHAMWRAAVLVFLGVFLASAWSRQTDFVFTNVLSQIGLGYVFVFLTLFCPIWVQVAVLVVVLVGDWALFASYPLPAPGSPITRLALVNLTGWQSGFAAHWQKGLNVAAAFDRWFLNLFPRPERFFWNKGGYQTLNFIPSIATMQAGALAGQWLRSGRDGRTKARGLFLIGSACLIIGTALDPLTVMTTSTRTTMTVICPIVKRLWTPSWVVYSTAWTCWLLAFFYAVIDVGKWRRWSFPFVVVGMNSIAMYMMAQLMKPWVRDQLKIHVGTLFGWLHDRAGLALDRDLFASDWGPFHESLVVLAVLWLICLWLYRNKVFLRI